MKKTTKRLKLQRDVVRTLSVRLPVDLRDVKGANDEVTHCPTDLGSGCVPSSNNEGCGPAA